MILNAIMLILTNSLAGFIDGSDWVLAHLIKKLLVRARKADKIRKVGSF